MGKVITQKDAIKAAEMYRKVELAIGAIESDVKGKQAAVSYERAEELTKLEARKEKAALALASYMEDNREDLLTGTKKSLEFAGLNMGYKKSKKKLGLSEDVTWESVLEKIAKDKAFKKMYTTTSTALNKTELQKADADTLGVLGLEVTQEETFFVKL